MIKEEIAEHKKEERIAMVTYKEFPSSLECFKFCLTGVPVLVQWKRIQLGIMRLWVRSLASLSGLRTWHCCGSGLGRQQQLRLDP